MESRGEGGKGGPGAEGHGEGLNLSPQGTYVPAPFYGQTWLRRTLFFDRCEPHIPFFGCKRSLTFGKCFSYVYMCEFRTSNANRHLKDSFHSKFTIEQRILLVTVKRTRII